MACSQCCIKKKSRNNSKYFVPCIILASCISCKLLIYSSFVFFYPFFPLLSAAGRRHITARQPETRRPVVSFTHALLAFFLSSARAKETRWAISSSIGVTPENSARDPDPGQFSFYLVNIKMCAIASRFEDVCGDRGFRICHRMCTAWTRFGSQYGGRGCSLLLP